MKNLSTKKEREAKNSLKKMLEILEPYLPPKPKLSKQPCEDWQPAGGSTPETELSDRRYRPEHRESL